MGRKATFLALIDHSGLLVVYCYCVIKHEGGQLQSWVYEAAVPLQFFFLHCLVCKSNIFACLFARETDSIINVCKVISTAAEHTVAAVLHILFGEHGGQACELHCSISKYDQILHAPTFRLISSMYFCSSSNAFVVSVLIYCVQTPLDLGAV